MKEVELTNPLFSPDRLPRKAAVRTVMLGAMIGCSMRGLRWAQEHLREEVAARAAAVEAAAVEGREEVVDDMKEAAESLLIQHPKPS